MKQTFFFWGYPDPGERRSLSRLMRRHHSPILGSRGDPISPSTFPSVINLPSGQTVADLYAVTDRMFSAVSGLHGQEIANRLYMLTLDGRKVLEVTPAIVTTQEKGENVMSSGKWLETNIERAVANVLAHGSSPPEQLPAMLASQRDAVTTACLSKVGPSGYDLCQNVLKSARWAEHNRPTIVRTGDWYMVGLSAVSERLRTEHPVIYVEV